ncbi:MAG TPA: hypothetical protein VK786_01225 [bacterium]|jgi:hypothetical protein|nr:hypothetical protein [bacterium]
MKTEFVLCIKNEGYAVSLEAFKIYRTAPALAGDQARGMTRIIDESGEDYLYPSKYFIPNPVKDQVGKILAGKFRSAARQKIAA